MSIGKRKEQGLVLRYLTRTTGYLSRAAAMNARVITKLASDARPLGKRNSTVSTLTPSATIAFILPACSYLAYLLIFGMSWTVRYYSAAVRRAVLSLPKNIQNPGHAPQGIGNCAQAHEGDATCLPTLN